MIEQPGALGGLSDEELDLVERQAKTVVDRVWAERFARVARREIDGETWAVMELRLQEAADPETWAAFEASDPSRSRRILVDGAPPPSEWAIESTAFSMVREGFSEEVVAVEVTAAALERGTDRQTAMAATARGIGRARRSRRAAA